VNKSSKSRLTRRKREDEENFRYPANMSDYVKKLSIIQQIREQAGGELEVPQICVLGDQGSGKSSCLASLVPGLAGVLPIGRGTVTRCPMVIRVKPGKKELVLVGTGVNQKKFDVSSTAGKREANSALVAAQQELLKCGTNTDDDENEKEQPVCDSEVIVEYVGIDAVDLVLVDLPGLIQSGAGVGKVEMMARRYIAQESTLIVIIREADLDEERAAAVELAAEADPNQDRTLQVLSKCDVFSKSEGKDEVLRLIESQPENQDSDTSLAIHLTCCDPKQETETEVNYFKENTFNMYRNVGSRDLATRRLPHLLAQRITGCKPAILRQIRDKQTRREKCWTGSGACQGVRTPHALGLLVMLI
jgi:GTP-binding protein EngB required for normal cell division